MYNFNIKNCDKEPLSNLTIFSLGHEEEQFQSIKNRSYIKFINLGSLNVGKYQRNDFAENRFFYSGFEKSIKTDYVGICSASWAKKYAYINSGKKILLSEHLNNLNLQKNVIWTPSKSNEDWFDFSLSIHPGIEKYLNHMISVTKINPHNTSLWSNNFICHKDVLLDFLEFFKSKWNEFNKKFQWSFDYQSVNVKKNTKFVDNRNSGMLGERLSMFYWADKDDMDIRNISYCPYHKLNSVQ